MGHTRDVTAEADELAAIVFDLETDGLPAKAITRTVTAAVMTWALRRGWLVKAEVRVELPGPSADDSYGFIDLVIRRGGSLPDIAVEIDQEDKQWSLAKLQYAAAAGMNAVWIRWSGERWSSLGEIEVIHLPQARKQPIRRPVSMQVPLWSRDRL